MAMETVSDGRAQPAWERTGANASPPELGATRRPGPPTGSTPRQPGEPAAPVGGPRINSLAEGSTAPESASVRRVPTAHLSPGRLQPRRRFDEEALRTLAESIKACGLLQPIVVRPHPEEQGRFEIVAGERRWRAAHLARVPVVPVLVRQVSDRDALGLALVENVQREDLTPLETAEGYRRLIDEFGYSQGELARLVGKSRSQVANVLRLLGLPRSVKQMIQDGRLSAGHARALLTSERPEELAQAVAAEGLAVREVERRVAGGRGRRVPVSGSSAAPMPKLAALERDLGTLLGVKVTVSSEGAGGAVILHYESLSELQALVRKLSQTHRHASGGPARPGAGAASGPRAARHKAPLDLTGRSLEPPRSTASEAPTRNVEVYGPAPAARSQDELWARYGRTPS